MTIKVLSDFRHRLGPARDQGIRPTCLSFAASDAHASLRNPWNELSCEFLHYHAQLAAKRSPDNGALLPKVLSSLTVDGQPLEEHWPYLDVLPIDLTSYRPPDVTNAKTFFCKSHRLTATLNEVIINLEQERISMIVMTLSASFDTPDADGVVRLRSQELPDITRRHAVVVVGHGTIDGDRALLIRNSWSEDWGEKGHAWLPEPFLVDRLLHAALLAEIQHVHS